MPDFPDAFVWGAATSAYQIEGSPLADGAGPSMWHRFAHTPGNVAGHQTGDVACDHYTRWASDVDLMAELGLQAYRFSVAWGRVLPDGTGRVNEAGLDFYDRLVDRLLDRGIAPFLTLYHWDLPAALDDRGGWLNRDVADWFAEYAAVVGQRLGDRVQSYATINEPWVVMNAGYVEGPMAPGRRMVTDGPVVAHNLLRAHGAGVRALRAETSADLGIVLNLEPKVPATPADAVAAARADAFMNRIFLEPLFKGQYPDDLVDLFGAAWPEHLVRDGDWDLIQTPVDWLGINYYTRAVVADEPGRYPDGVRRVRQARHPYTEMGWEVHAPSFRDLLVHVQETYAPGPIFVTENGAAFYDPPQPVGGRVDDPLRAAYLRDHLRAVRDANTAGADVRGYFAWSLFDNFEWALGYQKRFGIVHVDFETQERTPKTSARVYREIIGANGADLGGYEIPASDAVDAEGGGAAPASLAPGHA